MLDFNQEPPHLVITRQNSPYHHQIQPYGKLGDPYIISKHTIAYDPDDNLSTYTETRINSNTKWSTLQLKRLNQQLDKCFPFLYVITHGACLILNSIIQIGFQIALMSINGALWWVGAGIWTGVYFIITGIVTLMLGNSLMKFNHISVDKLKNKIKYPFLTVVISVMPKR